MADAILASGEGDSSESGSYAGTYEVNTEFYTEICSDGRSTPVLPQYSQIMVVQNGSTITFTGEDLTEDNENITYISDTGTTGEVNPDGSFTLVRRVTFYFNVLVELVGEQEQSASVTLTGQFTDAGWSGTRTTFFSLQLEGDNQRCQGVTSFSGARL